MFDAYDDWQKDDFLARCRVPAEGDDLAKQLTQRIVQTSWGAFGGKLDEIAIATGIKMASKYAGIQLRREYIYQKPKVPYVKSGTSTGYRPDWLDEDAQVPIGPIKGAALRMAEELSVENVVLPERPKHSVYPAHGSGFIAMYPAYTAEEHFALLETKLAEAIAQRDAARKEKESDRIEYAKLYSNALATANVHMQSLRHLEKKYATTEAALAESLVAINDLGADLIQTEEKVKTAESALASLEEKYDSAKDEWMEDLRTANEAMGTKNRNRSNWVNVRAVKAEIQRDAAQKQILDNLIAHGHRMSEQVERAEKAEAALAAETSRNFNFSGDNGV